jgi:hypothetical protein
LFTRPGPTSQVYPQVHAPVLAFGIGVCCSDAHLLSGTGSVQKGRFSLI